MDRAQPAARRRPGGPFEGIEEVMLPVSTSSIRALSAFACAIALVVAVADCSESSPGRPPLADLAATPLDRALSIARHDAVMRTMLEARPEAWLVKDDRLESMGWRVNRG